MSLDREDTKPRKRRKVLPTGPRKRVGRSSRCSPEASRAFTIPQRQQQPQAPSSFTSALDYMRSRQEVPPLIGLGSNSNSNNNRNRNNIFGAGNKQDVLSKIRDVEADVRAMQTEAVNATEKAQRLQKKMDTLHMKHWRLSMNNARNVTEVKDLQRANKKLEKERDEYKEKLDENIAANNKMSDTINTMNGTSKKVETFSLSRLNALELELQNGLNKVQECRQRIIDDAVICTVCQENKKNISFTDGCGHVCICEQCETKMEPMRCPVCREPYSQTKKVKI